VGYVGLTCYHGTTERRLRALTDGEGNLRLYEVWVSPSRTVPDQRASCNSGRHRSSAVILEIDTGCPGLTLNHGGDNADYFRATGMVPPEFYRLLDGPSLSSIRGKYTGFNPETGRYAERL